MISAPVNISIQINFHLLLLQLWIILQKIPFENVPCMPPYNLSLQMMSNEPIVANNLSIRSMRKLSVQLDYVDNKLLSAIPKLFGKFIIITHFFN